MRPIARKQQGSILVLFSLSLMALFGVMALTIDLTRLFLAQSHLQSLADSCALAGMSVLPCAQPSLTQTTCTSSDFTAAVEAGQHIAQLNQDNPSITTVQLRFPEKNRIQCQVDLNGLMPSLMQVLGVGIQSLHAEAIATVWPHQGECGRCGGTRYPGSLQSNGALIPVLIQ